MENEQQILGVCWYQSGQWERLREISEDRNDLEETYEEWRKNAHKTIQDLESEGHRIQKVKIDLEELVIWCNEKRIPINMAARAEYVSTLLQQKYNKS